MVIYEPEIKEDYFQGIEVIHHLDNFKERAALIVANRMSPELRDVAHRVYTRDLYGRD